MQPWRCRVSPFSRGTGLACHFQIKPTGVFLAAESLCVPGTVLTHHHPVLGETDVTGPQGGYVRAVGLGRDLTKVALAGLPSMTWTG